MTTTSHLFTIWLGAAYETFAGKEWASSKAEALAKHCGASLEDDGHLYTVTAD